MPIYGHNLKVGGEMFSQLNEYADEAFYKEHPYFYIYTPDGKTRMYEVFMAGVVSDQAENYTMKFESDDAYLNYLDTCRKSSAYQTDASLSAGSRIVTLSTCTNVRDDERFIVQGVLVTEESVSYTHLRAHETGRNLVCRLLLEKKKKKKQNNKKKK